MPALQPQLTLTTLEEYDALPEDTRAEIFDGQIFYMSSPSQEHQTISMELSTILNTYIKNSKGEVWDGGSFRGEMKKGDNI